MAPLMLFIAVGCQPTDPPAKARRGAPSGDSGDHEGDSGTPDDPGDTGTSSGGDTGHPPVEGCRATPRGADHPRTGVLALPYSAAGDPADSWTSFTLDVDGNLELSSNRFEMGRAWEGTVRFSPDGSLGVVAQDDGSIGVFSVSEAGEVTVVNPNFNPGFYAADVWMDASGEIAWIVDGNWANNGGGVYRVDLDCATGAPSDGGLVLESKLAAGLRAHPHATDRMILFAQEIGGADDDHHVGLLAWSAEAPELLAAATAFAYPDAVISAVAVMPGAQHVLVADNSLFSGTDNRIAAVTLSDDTLAYASDVVIEDPVAILPSPHGGAALVVSGYGDAMWVLDYDPDNENPLSLRGELSYGGAAPALPGPATVVSRGTWAGLALVAENQGLRRVHMQASGDVVDLGVTSIGDGFDAIPGAVGIQP